MLQRRAAECSSWREACVLGHGSCSIWQLANLESFQYYDTASVLQSFSEDFITSTLQLHQSGCGKLCASTASIDLKDTPNLSI